MSGRHSVQQASTRAWSSYNDKQEQVYERLSFAYAALTCGLGEPVDPDSHVAKYGNESAFQQAPGVTLIDTVRSVLTMIDKAFKEAMAADEQANLFAQAVAKELASKK
ncbi:MAG: hypothetical protein QM749_03035 [Aquabacterium sp.]